MFLSDRTFACLPSISEPHVVVMTYCESDDEKVKHPFAATELMLKAEVCAPAVRFERRADNTRGFNDTTCASGSTFPKDGHGTAADI